MAVFKKVAYAACDAASNTSLTSAVAIPTEFSEYAILIPPIFGITATVGVKVLVSDSESGDYYEVAYSNPPSTATCSLVNQVWQSPASAACGGAMVICEALRFCPGYAKFQFLNTATANTGIGVYGRLEN